MERLNKILVAIDFSDYSAEIFDYGYDLAEAMQAGLVLVNVLNQRDVVAVE